MRTAVPALLTLLLTVTTFGALGASPVAAADATADPIGSVAGQVRVASGAVPFTLVELVRMPADPTTQIDAYHWVRHDITSTEAAADGTWRFDDVPPGDYTVKFMPPASHVTHWYGGTSDRTRVRSFTVGADGAGAHVTRVGQVLVPSATVRGRVKFPGGVPVANAFVQVQRWQNAPTFAAGGYWEDAIIPTTHPVASDGTWSIRGLGGDRHRLVFLSPGNDVVVWRLVEGQPNWRYVTPAPGQVLVLDDTVVPPQPGLKKITRLKAPKITGRAKVGRTLKVSRGTWSPGNVTVKYQWQSRKVTKKGVKVVPITKALKKGTASKVKLTRVLKGRAVRVRITVSKPGHRTVVHTTRWTRKIA